MKIFLKILALNVAILLPGLIVLELIFGGWFTDEDPLLNFSRPRNVEWTFRVPWQPEGAEYSRDQFGLRGLDGKPDDVFILTVGGSTTDQRYLSTQDTWQEALQSRLGEDGKHYEVVNAGIDGQSTVGHIKNFKQWFNRIENFRPDYILFYIGVNDFYIADGNVSDANLEKNRSFRKYVNKSALVAAGKIVRDALRSKKRDETTDRKPGHSFNGIDTSTYVDKRELADCCTDQYLVRSMLALQQRVKLLAELTEQMGARAIFVNQRSSLWIREADAVRGAPVLTYADPSTLKNLGTITGVDRHDIEAFQAEHIMAGCREAGAICIDFVNEALFDLEKDFYDDMHNTPSGARKIGDYFFEKLKHLRPS